MKRDLQRIPGVGESLAQDLLDLGYRRAQDLVGENPVEMYERLCGMRGTRIDRCVLYVFRGAVYYASTQDPEPDLLHWWNWSDARIAARAAS